MAASKTRSAVKKANATSRRKELTKVRSEVVNQKFEADTPTEFALELGEMTMPYVILTNTPQGREIVKEYAKSGITFEDYAFVSQDGPLKGRMVADPEWFAQQDVKSIGTLVLRFVGTQLRGVVY